MTIADCFPATSVSFKKAQPSHVNVIVYSQTRRKGGELLLKQKLTVKPGLKAYLVNV